MKLLAASSPFAAPAPLQLVIQMRFFLISSRSRSRSRSSHFQLADRSLITT